MEHLFSFFLDASVQHTSASLTINENYDSEVRDDNEAFMNRVVPEESWVVEDLDAKVNIDGFMR